MKNSLIIFLVLIFSISVASKLTIKIRTNSGYKNDLSNELESFRQPNANRTAENFTRAAANRTRESYLRYNRQNQNYTA